MLYLSKKHSGDGGGEAGDNEQGQINECIVTNK